MYQALYRKWRPRVFADVVGQPAVTAALQNELRAGRVGHAYLFTGSRGTGKTTCAKILAKAVNCLNPQNGDPCGKCENCRGIDSGAVLDVVEIDAASNNGVDNIRELREETGFTPAAAKYRVYIIDEVHMLSTGAFNALLKTLEEPPDYVIFILATTELHKIPATILSRCQCFEFRRIPPQDIADRLLYIAEQERIPLEPAAAALIARLSDGGMRDALSLLDQCAGGGEKTVVDEAAVAAAAGLAGRGYLHELAVCIRDADASAAMRLIDQLYASAKDVERLCEELMLYFRNLMMLKTVRDTAFLALPNDELDELNGLAEGFSIETVLHILDSLQDTLDRLHRSSARRVELEMGILRLIRPELDTSASALTRRFSALEAKLNQLASSPSAPARPIPGGPADAAERPAGKKASGQPEKPPGTNGNGPEPHGGAAVAPESEPAADEPLPVWAEVLAALGASDPPLRGVLDGSGAVVRGGHVLIDSSNSVFASLIRQPSHQKALVEAVRRVTGKPYKVGVLKRNIAAGTAKENDPLDEIAGLASAAGIPVSET